MQCRCVHPPCTAPQTMPHHTPPSPDWGEGAIRPNLLPQWERESARTVGGPSQATGRCEFRWPPENPAAPAKLVRRSAAWQVGAARVAQSWAPAHRQLGRCPARTGLWWRWGRSSEHANLKPYHYVTWVLNVNISAWVFCVMNWQYRTITKDSSSLHLNKQVLRELEDTSILGKCFSGYFQMQISLQIWIFWFIQVIISPW